MTKKILFILLIGIVSIFSIQCSKEKRQARNQKSYEVKSQFFYSDDAGRTYGNSRREFKVGETVYMKLNIEVYEKKPKNFLGYVGGGVAAGAGTGFVAGSLIPIPVVTSVIGAVIGALVGGASGVGAFFITKPPSLDFVNCELIIPNITSVDARNIGGGRINPLPDEVAGITTYPIKVGISEKNKDASTIEWSFLFQFIPNRESEISMELIFDDNIAEQYDRMDTLIFVK